MIGWYIKEEKKNCVLDKHDRKLSRLIIDKSYIHLR